MENGEQQNWGRIVMRRSCEGILATLGVQDLRTLEISGEYYRDQGFLEYNSVSFPDFDICTDVIDDSFDLIIAEQVFEHLLWPYRAGRNVYGMLNDGGHFLISTPFLVRVHRDPHDCTRWTETGLKYFLAECGFAIESIQTWSWGNRACVVANFPRWVAFQPDSHSLANEPAFPYHVWALAER